jgi:hypothetical protein
MRKAGIIPSGNTVLLYKDDNPVSGPGPHVTSPINTMDFLKKISRKVLDILTIHIKFIHR